MARKQKDPNENPEAPNPYQSAVPQGGQEDVDHETPLVNQSPMLGSAVDHDGRPMADVPPPPRYRVLRGQYVMIKGMGRMTLREGKVIDENNYDIASLRSQGVQLEALE